MLLRHSIPTYGHNTLGQRIKDFGLNESFVRYPLLVKYNWLRPAFHVPVPEDWMTFYVDSAAVAQWPHELSNHWASRFDSRWLIDAKEIGADEWFVNPLFRRGASRVEFFEHAKAAEESHEWIVQQTRKEFRYIAAFDYFYEWQLFRFADVVDREREMFPHFWLPGSYAELLAHAEQSTVEIFDRLTVAPKWDEWGRTFTKLAYFIEFSETFDHHEAYSARREAADQFKQLTSARREGAIGLMSWLGYSASELENDVTACILVIANDWRHRYYHENFKTVRLWRALQSQVRHAIAWLTLVNDLPIAHYLDALRYPKFQDRGWSRLEDVLPYPLWKSAVDASRLLNETAARYHSVPGFQGFQVTPLQLVELGEKVDGFDAYIDAHGRLIEESTYISDDDPFRRRSRASWYRLIAIVGYNILEETIKQPTYRNANLDKKPMCAIAELLSGKGAEWKLFHENQRTQRQSWSQTLSNIAAGIHSSKDTENLVLYFSLAMHYTRNATAHTHGEDEEFLYATWAAPIFDALEFFVPWALIELAKTSATASNSGLSP
jgi:hypothetical protein